MIKKHWKRAEKAKNTPLGPGGRVFKSLCSGQKVAIFAYFKLKS